jgi:hypothetical protein
MSGGGGVADVGERHVQQHADVAIGKPVVGHPAGPAGCHDPVRAQQPEMMGDRGLARVRDGGQVRHARLALEERDEHPQPARVGEQTEHVRQVSQLSSRRHGRRGHSDPASVYDPDRVMLQVRRNLFI